MLSYRLGAVNDFHWGLNQFLASANLILSQHISEKKKCIYSLQPGHFKAEQNIRRVKRSTMKKKGVKIAH